MRRSKLFDISKINVEIPKEIKKFDPSYVTRYVIVTELVKKLAKASKAPIRVLDVGGYNGAASQLLEGCEVTVLDMFEDASDNYIQYDGGAMPFEAESFDVVISCDTLEHVPEPQRDYFIEEMHRVSKDCLIFCAPFGAKEVELAELRADMYYQGLTAGKSYIWLKEHREYGLPQKNWLESKLSTLNTHFTSFDHTSLMLWELMLRANFFLASNLEPVAPTISKKLKRFNEEYLHNFTFNDFPEYGYRTFYVCSKRSPVEVKVPLYEENVTNEFLNRQLYLTGKHTQEVSKMLGLKAYKIEAATAQAEKLQARLNELEQKNQALTNEINAIRSSKSFRAVRAAGVAKKMIARKQR